MIIQNKKIEALKSNIKQHYYNHEKLTGGIQNINEL